MIDEENPRKTETEGESCNMETSGDMLPVEFPLQHINDIQNDRKVY